MDFDDFDFDDDSGGDNFDDDGGDYEDYETENEFAEVSESNSDLSDSKLDFDWEDMATIGGMAEEFGEEEKERLRIKRKFEKDNGN